MKQTKELILNSLNNDFEVKGIKKDDEGDDVGIIVEFMFNGKFGTCRICLEGRERGVDWCNYPEGEENIYSEILDWFWDSNDINWKTTIKYKGKVL